MLRRRLALAALAATVAALPLSLTSVGATTARENGQIAFRRFLDPLTSALFVIRPDGSGDRQLTYPKTGDDDDQPDWAPDGSKVAFDRLFESLAGRSEVLVVTADGTGLRRLGPDCSDVPPPKCEDRSAPAWSPDGRRIAFGRASGAARDQIQYSEVWIMDPNGHNARQLTHFTMSEPYSADVGNPTWSPDGRRLVFEVHTSATGTPAWHIAIFVVNADGSGLRQLTAWKLNGGDHPDWSRDGRRILFRTVPRGDYERPGGNLYTIRPDARGLRKLTHFTFTTRLLGYSFSQDGRWITLAKADPGEEPNLFVMRSNGTGMRQLTRTPRRENAPDWGPTR